MFEVHQIALVDNPDIHSLSFSISLSLSFFLLKASSSPGLRQKVGTLWIHYLHEDAVERDEKRWRHLEKMQRRKEEQYPRISREYTNIK